MKGPRGGKDDNTLRGSSASILSFLELTRTSLSPPHLEGWVARATTYRPQYPQSHRPSGHTEAGCGEEACPSERHQQS